jgi:hypothetical protein
VGALTDGSTTTSVGVPLPAVGGAAFVQASLPLPGQLLSVTVRCSLAVGSVVSIMGVTANDSLVALGTVSVSWEVHTLDVLTLEVLVAVRLECAVAFQAWELAARSEDCFEHATVDLGSVVGVGALWVRHYAGSIHVRRTRYQLSVDGAVWETVMDGVDPMLVGGLDVEVSPAVSARYVRVRHDFAAGRSGNVYVWEVVAWGPEGKYGTPPAAVPNPVSFRELLGINGIWGFGGQGWSNLARPNWGPGRYSKFSRHGRNYHNWIWDVYSPREIPQFDRMVPPGSIDFGVLPGHSGGLRSDWLNWDHEYTTWRGAGLMVHVSIQFTTDMIPESAFVDAYTSGYNYGFAFARHFGPTLGTGDVSVAEVGNEPWKYSAQFYSDVLLGMARGLKEGDPAMRVLPAAFPLDELAKRLNSSHMQYLDGLNVHLYSFRGGLNTYLNETHSRVGTFPESPSSSMRELFAFGRFRDANAPGLPLLVTEWGWDSAGGGEGCDFPECVSEAAQALYAVRGALVLARWGAEQLSWFFYANLVPKNTKEPLKIFDRCGVFSSKLASYRRKASVRAMEHFARQMGNLSFLDVLREKDDGWVYLVGKPDRTRVYVVAWAPVDAENTSVFDISFHLEGNPIAVESIVPDSSVRLSALPQVKNSTWYLRVSRTPVMVLYRAPSLAFTEREALVSVLRTKTTAELTSILSDTISRCACCTREMMLRRCEAIRGPWAFTCGVPCKQ